MKRRQFLTRAALGAGALTLSPSLSPWSRSVLAQIEKRASGEDSTPRRFVFCVKSNGLWAENIQPTGFLDRLPFAAAYDKDGRLVDGKHGAIRKKPTAAADLALEEGGDLPEVMKPLEPFRERLSVLQGVAGGFAVYHDGHYQALGAFAARRRDTSEVGGQTIDSFLARAFPGPVPHVCLGHDPKAASGISYLTTSALAKDKPLPFFTKPARAYKDLFGVVGKGAAKAEYDTHSDILDFYVEDAKRLRGAVAPAEREQLDRYLDAFESVRKSRQRIEAMSDELRKWAPVPPGDFPAQSTTQIGAANADLAIASLASGLTNVVTISFDSLGSSSYPSLKVGGLHGSVGHGQGGDVAGKRQRICRYQFEQIAKIAGALARIPEGDGTMLDNTLIVYTSNNGETHHSSGKNWPILTLGGLGGAWKTGRYFSPGNDHDDKEGLEHVRLGDVWSTILAATRQPFSGFGHPKNGVTHRPIPSLLS